jgi:hypothetical protein
LRIREEQVEKCKEKRVTTTRKHYSFVDFFKFIGIDKYIQIIFIGSETDECKVIFIGLGRAPMNIWSIWFDFDYPIYSSVRPHHR